MHKFFPFLLVLLFLQTSVRSQEITSRSQKIKKHIQYLASDELNGRYPGSEGEYKAATYILTQWQASGLTPLFTNGFQDFKTEMKSRKNPDSVITLQGRNVAVWIKGQKNADEYIVVGAHYDHLGMGGSGSGSRMPDTIAVHNGADDNASGIAMLIECAKALAKQKPERSIIFVAFSAEEEGLIGSKYFIENPPVSKEKIKAMINFDMVGRLDSVLYIEGTATATQFDSLITLTQGKEPFQIQRSPGGFGPSDQTSFYAEKIPVLFFHTSIHEQYHTPFDDWELINVAGEAQIANFADRLILKLANHTQPLTYFSMGNQMDMSRSGMKVTLGVMPDHASGVKGLKINSVTAGKAAERAGLQKGDVITSIQGEKVEGIESYMQQMNKCSKGQIIIIDILRNNEKQIITVTL